MPPADPKKLSKYQTNDLFRVVEASRVPVTQFKLVTRATVTIIRHSKSGSTFGAWKAERKLAGDDLFNMWEEVGTWKSEGELFAAHVHYNHRVQPVLWHDLLRRAGGWTYAVERFVSDADRLAATPDLWAELYRFEKYVRDQRQRFENTPFTHSEQVTISAQIEDLKNYIKTAYDLTSAQMSRVEAVLDHAAEASKRIGRKDWLLLFYGAVSSLILTDLITPQAAQHIILLGIHGLSYLFGFGGPLSQLPPGG